MADVLVNELRQVQLNVGFRDESCFVGVSITFTGKGEEKGPRCKVHKCPAANCLVSRMPQMPCSEIIAPCSRGLSQSKYPELGPTESPDLFLRKELRVSS